MTGIGAVKSKQKNKAVHTLEEMDANIVGTEARLSSVQLQGPNRIEEGKFHLKVTIKSYELKEINKIESNKKIYKILTEEIKEYIHSIQILII